MSKSNILAVIIIFTALSVVCWILSFACENIAYGIFSREHTGKESERAVFSLRCSHAFALSTAGFILLSVLYPVLVSIIGFIERLAQNVLT